VTSARLLGTQGRERVTVTVGTDVATFSGDGLRAGDGCTDLAHGVHCSNITGGVVLYGGRGRDRLVSAGQGAQQLPVSLVGGRGADRLELGGAAASFARGGPGADALTGNLTTEPTATHYGIPTAYAGATLHGGPGDDRLAGAAGEDELMGGAGSDGIQAGGGDDRIRGGPGADRLVGGRGEDQASWDRAVVADLLAGRASDGDRLLGVDDLLGGAGTDVLRGDDGSNFLDGGADGHGDRLSGRGGDDLLSVRPGGVARCGPGNDEVLKWSRRVRIADDCERTDRARRRAGWSR
jgi:Ca2+-binding RTX toxin-like protein